MSEYADRIAAAQKLMRAEGVDAMCLSVGSDLPYLTGYKAMPLERLTMLILPAEGDGTVVLPGLEAPRVHSQDLPFSVHGWGETEDPIKIVDGLLRGAGRLLIGDETWSRFLIDLQDVDASRSFAKASDLMATLRMVKSPAEIAKLRERGGQALDNAVATDDGAADART